MEIPDGSAYEEELAFGDIVRVPLEERMAAKAVLTPHHGFDVGAGPEKPLNVEIEGGVVGVVIDTRGRPLTLPEDGRERRRTLLKWYEALDLYPEEFMTEWGR